MNKEIIVIEDFYDDPHAVREFALTLKYTDFDGHKNFLGKESVTAYPPAKIIKRLSAAVGADLVNVEGDIFGRFRIAKGGEHRRTKVHVDRCDFAANIYLTPTATASMGLGIYRHLPTGLSQVPSENQLKSMGYKSMEEFDAKVIFPDSLDETKWARINLIEPKFNSCVIIPGSKYFHAAENGRGNCYYEARLSQHFFTNVRSE